jgi:hypothetical protein
MDDSATVEEGRSDLLLVCAPTDLVNNDRTVVSNVTEKQEFR